MLDLMYLAGGLAFLGCAVAYLRFCERVTRRDGDS
jgi:hypothetical protein